MAGTGGMEDSDPKLSISMATRGSLWRSFISGGETKRSDHFVRIRVACDREIGMGRENRPGQKLGPLLDALSHPFFGWEGSPTKID